MSVRVTSLMQLAGVDNIEGLTRFSAADLLKYKHIGRKTVGEVEDLLEDLGLYLRGAGPTPNGPVPAAKRILCRAPDPDVTDHGGGHWFTVVAIGQGCTTPRAVAEVAANAYAGQTLPDGLHVLHDEEVLAYRWEIE
jgi:hypothetical protein